MSAFLSFGRSNHNIGTWLEVSFPQCDQRFGSTHFVLTRARSRCVKNLIPGWKVMVSPGYAIERKRNHETPFPMWFGWVATHQSNTLESIGCRRGLTYR
jgi:hypothetical protein